MGYIAVAWNYYYEGVTRANSALRVAAITTEISDSELNNIKGQARFIRGHFYMYLKKMFKNVPWIDENTKEYNQPNTEDIWPEIEADFMFAMENLPTTQTDVGRANKWAAASYLAKVYLYQGKWDKAKELFDIISQGVTSNGLKYDLVENYADNFNAATENNKESVFAVQMIAHDGTNDILNANVGDMLNFPYGGPFTCCGIFQPSQDLVNSFRTNTITGLPYLDEYNTHAVKHDQGLESSEPFTPDDGTVDPRLDWTVGRREIPYLDWGNHPGKAWIRDQNYAGPYSPKKNVYWQATQDEYAAFYSWAPGTALNLLIIRFADVLLMAAEAEAHLGNLDIAQSYVNQVRNRASNPIGFVKKYLDENDPLAGFSSTPAANYLIHPYPNGDFSAKGKDYALNAIYFERKLELGMEGHRYFDLSRWGIAEKTLNKYYEYEKSITNDLGAHFTASKNEYYPIPQSQIDLSVSNGVQILTQNRGY